MTQQPVATTSGLDPNCVGNTAPSQPISWASRDTLLYALGPVGRVPRGFNFLAYGRVYGLPLGATIAVLLCLLIARRNPEIVVAQSDLDLEKFLLQQFQDSEEIVDQLQFIL